MTTKNSADYFEAYGSQAYTPNPRFLKELDTLIRTETSNHLSPEEMQDMPWGSEYLTTIEFMLWVASREAAGATIDIETCELDRWYACDFDVYGLAHRLDTLDPYYDQIGANYYVRSPTSNGWVHTDDLPPAITQDMVRARIDRDWIAFCKSNPDD